MMKLRIFSMLLLAAGMQAAAASPREMGKNSVVIDGVTRTYLYHLPASPHAQANAPLVLVFHGGGGRGRSMERLTGLNRLADREGFIVVYPDGLQRHWNDSRNLSTADDAKFVRALIREMEKDHSVDRRRIYAAGISNGGFFSIRLACDLSDTIAAVAAVAATMPAQLPGQCRPVRPISVLFMHGTSDPLVPIQGGGIAGGRHGQAVSLEAAVRFWREHDRAAASPQVERLPHHDASDPTRVERRTYGGGSEGSEVVAYIIQNGGHTWPGGWQYAPAILVGKTTHDIEGSDVIWQFFKRHHLP